MLIRAKEVEFIKNVKRVIAKMKEVKTEILSETDPVSLMSQGWEDRFTTLLGHLHELFPSDVRDTIVLGEIHERVYHLERYWSKMCNAIRQVNEGG